MKTSTTSCLTIALCWLPLFKLSSTELTYETRCSGIRQDDALGIGDGVIKCFLERKKGTCTEEWENSHTSCDPEEREDRCLVSMDYIVRDAGELNCEVASTANKALWRCAETEQKPAGVCVVSNNSRIVLIMQYFVTGTDIHSSGHGSRLVDRSREL
ncbi:hypothetical protein BR93DRAFT_927331 [Coniochaeta sp. PMI_546]|nr:hypothetical protein BR93DRAFT_927331 [Coniochaeta sp. PMI_546]